MNLLFLCTLETENTAYFFLPVRNNLLARTTLLDELSNISNTINSFNSSGFIRVILYVDKNFDDLTNLKIKTAIINFNKKTKRFARESRLLISFRTSSCGQVPIFSRLKIRVYVHPPWRLHLSESGGIPGNRSTMLCWTRWILMPIPFIATLECRT